MRLPDDLQQFVDYQVSVGAFENADEVVTAALSMMRDQHYGELKIALDAGLRQLENGECIHLPDEHARRVFFENLKSGIKVPEPCPVE